MAESIALGLFLGIANTHTHKMFSENVWQNSHLIFLLVKITVLLRCSPHEKFPQAFKP
jgi:hypothetical protein